MSFDEILDLTADFFSFYNRAFHNIFGCRGLCVVWFCFVQVQSDFTLQVRGVGAECGDWSLRTRGRLVSRTGSRWRRRGASNGTPCGEKYIRSTIYIPGSPSGCVWREIPGVTQVDKKEHEGNTAVVTAYLCWRKYIWSKTQQDRGSCWLLLFTFNIISYSYSNPAEYYYLLVNITILVQLWVAGEGPTIDWSYLPRKIVREKRLSFRGHGDCILLY